MKKPLYTTAASEDLIGILRYISQDKPAAAMAWVEKIEAKSHRNTNPFTKKKSRCLSLQRAGGQLTTLYYSTPTDRNSLAGHRVGSKQLTSGRD